MLALQVQAAVLAMRIKEVVDWVDVVVFLFACGVVLFVITR